MNEKISIGKTKATTMPIKHGGSLSISVRVQTSANLLRIANVDQDLAIQRAIILSGHAIKQKAIALADARIYNTPQPVYYKRRGDYGDSLHIGHPKNIFTTKRAGLKDWKLEYGSRMKYASMVEEGANTAAKGEGNIIRDATRLQIRRITDTFGNQISHMFSQVQSRVGGKFRSLDDLWGDDFG